MTTDNALTKEQQAAYFDDALCPFCGSPEVCVFPWHGRDSLAESRDVLCHDCKAEWSEVNCPIEGRRFLERHQLIAYEVRATVTVMHRLLMRIRARSEAEAVGKAELLEFDKMVKDDHAQRVFVGEQSVKLVEEWESAH